MSFDTLLWLGLTLLFVIAPLFSNRGKKPDQEQQPRQPGQRPGAPPASGQPRTRSAAPDGTQEQQGGWESRLEEARRRIEAALAEESAQLPPQRSAQPTPAAPAQQRPSAAQARKPASRPPPPSRSTSAASKQASIDRARRLRESESASAPQVTRPNARPTYTVRRRRADAGGLFETKSVVNGIIWHQILSEPRHKRGHRRRT